MGKMKDSCGFEIQEGLYEDWSGSDYYYIKETPKGLMKKRMNDTGYSPLDNITAANIRRIIHQKELTNLILSVEKEKSETENADLELEIRTGILGRIQPSQSQPK